MGCDKVQGFWYSKPLPAGQFEQWFKHYTARAA
jgi:EAL domain-containing protein (putative c-di-GMP-specific phosphodiesterase class I)